MIKIAQKMDFIFFKFQQKKQNEQIFKFDISGTKNCHKNLKPNYLNMSK